MNDQLYYRLRTDAQDTAFQMLAPQNLEVFLNALIAYRTGLTLKIRRWQEQQYGCSAGANEAQLKAAAFMQRICQDQEHRFAQALNKVTIAMSSEQRREKTEEFWQLVAEEFRWWAKNHTGKETEVKHEEDTIVGNIMAIVGLGPFPVAKLLVEDRIMVYMAHPNLICRDRNLYKEGHHVLMTFERISNRLYGKT